MQVFEERKNIYLLTRLLDHFSVKQRQSPKIKNMVLYKTMQKEHMISHKKKKKTKKMKKRRRRRRKRKRRKKQEKEQEKEQEEEQEEE